MASRCSSTCSFSPAVAFCDSDRLGIGGSRVAASTTPSLASISETDLDCKAPASRWMSKVVLAATAAATSLTLSTPMVHALEEGLSAYNTPGNLSMSIAIPIPDPDQWMFSEYGFIAPMPGKHASEEIRVLSLDTGCPAWQPTEFERVIPDHVRAKPYPRKGNQWPATLSAEDASSLRLLSDADQALVARYSASKEAVQGLLPSLPGLACFSL